MTDILIQLPTFTDAELIFDGSETKAILKFFFPDFPGRIDAAPVTWDLRNFAQGLLVSAVDLSYSMGFVEAIFRATANPTQPMRKVLTKFGQRAMKHWFKHHTNESLLNAKIYESIRRSFSRNFRSVFDGLMLAQRTSKGGIRMAYVNLPEVTQVQV